MNLLPLLPVVGGIAKAGYAGYKLTKLKEKDFHNTELESSLSRTIANNRADIVNKTLLNQTTSAAKSMGARLMRQGSREMGAARERGLLSSGQYAQSLLDLGEGIQSQVGDQQSQALMQNTQYAEGLRQQADQQLLTLAQAKDEARRAYLDAKEHYTHDLISGGFDAATALASGMAQIHQNNETKKMINNLMGSIGKPIGDWTTDNYFSIIAGIQLAQLGIDASSLAAKPGPLIEQVGGEGETPVTETVTKKETPLLTTGDTVEQLVSPQESEVKIAPPEDIKPTSTLLPLDMSVATESTEREAINMEMNRTAVGLHFKQSGLSSAYTNTMLNKLYDDYGGDVNDPGFVSWVKKQYTSKGTYDKFKRYFLEAIKKRGGK